MDKEPIGYYEIPYAYEIEFRGRFVVPATEEGQALEVGSYAISRMCSQFNESSYEYALTGGCYCAREPMYEGEGYD